VLLHPKQKYKCRDCDKQFVLNPEKKISEETAAKARVSQTNNGETDGT
jgi:transposase-like protein